MQNQEIKKIKIQLVVTRHGETIQNKNKIICGQNPGKLTESGKVQAQMIGIFLKEQSFNKIYISDLGRTKQTFQNIKINAPNLSKIQTKYESMLRQKSGGVLTGQSLSAWQRLAKKQNKNIREYRCKDGQSWVDVNKRVKKFIELCIQQNILEKQNPIMQQRILVVCHGGYIMEFHNVVRQIISKGKQKAVFTNSAKNCSIHVFEIEYPINKKKYSENDISIKCTINNFTEHLMLDK